MSYASDRDVMQELGKIARWLRAVEGAPMVIVRRDGCVTQWFHLRPTQ